jgi:Mg-chelatase subunit ChlD
MNSNNLQPTVLLVVDNSGSMSGVMATVRAKLADFFTKLQSKQIETELISFNTSIRHVKNPTSEQIYSVLYADGGTNLFGSMVRSVEGLLKYKTAREKCLIVVITDGQDTTRECEPADVASAVHIAEETMGWDFLFIGTNQDAYRVGTQLGIKPGKLLSFSNSIEGFEHMLEALSTTSTEWASGHISHDAEFFTEDVKNKQAELGAIVL